jgi:hypothetical protein
MKKSNPDQLDFLIHEVINSNTSMANSQFKNILDTCFIKERNSSAYTPIMIPFNIPLKGVTTQIEIPLITTIPVTMLAIDKANIHLRPGSQSEFAIKESTTAEHPEQEYHTNIQCNQLPLPQGLATLIEVLTNSITPE